MRVNWPICWIGALWWWIETNYFGWQPKPSCVAELFADGLALAFFAMAFAFPRREVTIIVNRGTEEPR